MIVMMRMIGGFDLLVADTDGLLYYSILFFYIYIFNFMFISLDTLWRLLRDGNKYPWAFSLRLFLFFCLLKCF